MFPKVLAFGIGALALVQGALAIAPGRYIITNPEMGTLISFRKGDSLLLSRALLPPPLGEWTVKELGQDEYTITNADASVYASQNTLVTGDHADTYSIKDAGNDEFVIKVPGTNRVWTAGQIDDPTVHLNPDQGENSQRWAFVPL